VTAQAIATTFSDFIKATGTGTMNIDKSIAGDNTMNIHDTGIYFIRLIKQAIERLSEIWLNMKLYVRSLRAEEVQTDKLCVGQTCITEKELIELMQLRTQYSTSSSSSSSSSGPPAPPPETTNSGTSSAPPEDTSSGSIVESGS
jgi:hypothetical protein